MTGVAPFEWRADLLDPKIIRYPHRPPPGPDALIPFNEDARDMQMRHR
jgi:hypothetical protein